MSPGLTHPALAEAADATPDEAAVARIISRLSAEYVFGSFQLLIGAFGDIRSGLLLMAINTANVAHIDARTEEGRHAAASDGLVEDDVRKPVTVARLAAIAGLSAGSTHRIVERLIDVGDCVRVGGGLIVPRAVFERPEFDSLTLANLRHVSVFVRELLRRGLVPEPPAMMPAWQTPVARDAIARTISRQCAEYSLRAVRLLGETYGDIPTGIVAQSIVAANTGHLDDFMGEGWRYAGIDQPAPDEIRKAVSVSAIARSLGVPYETLRRQVRRLIARGVCVRVEGGLIIPTSVVEQPAAARAMVANVRYVREFVRILRSLGLDPYES
jgi:DNA-binding Lrp family transcriptional regulator